MKLALFDLDHTLLPIDSDHSWGDHIIDLGWVDRVYYKARNDGFYEDYKAGRLNLHEYIAFSAEAFCKRTEAEANAAHAGFMAKKVEPAIHQTALDLIEKHRAAGDEIVIVTATNEFVTRPIAERFGVQHLIAVELERGAGGWFEPRIKGTPSFREGKVTRVQEWLAARGATLDTVAHSVFYSDSPNDLPLLEAVREPVATNPSPELREMALQRGWRVLDLFEH
jgi:HAD superfamily hydrolase (TIGR01490 family)